MGMSFDVSTNNSENQAVRFKAIKVIAGSFVVFSVLVVEMENVDHKKVRKLDLFAKQLYDCHCLNLSCKQPNL